MNDIHTRRQPFLMEKAAPAGTALLAFIVYLVTLSPTVGFIDAGELSAVACTLGIAHPTGYPLFTLLGWLFSRLPIATEQVVRLNVMAAFFCASGVCVFVHLLRSLLEKVRRQTGRGDERRGGQPPAAVTLAAVGAGLLLAFSETYWAQAVAVEVYSLHLLLLSSVTWLFFKASFDGRGAGERRWLLFAFVLGLSFTNHMTTILLAPGMLYFYFALQGWNRRSWQRIVRMAVPFVLGFSVYAYLPLRASQSPLMNWGNPVTLERFLWQFTGKQYRVWIFSSTAAAEKQFHYFLNSLPAEAGYIGLLFAVIGAAVLWKGHRKLFIATSLFVATCVLYSINYDIHDIDSYFLLAYFGLTIWSGVGIAWSAERLAAVLRGRWSAVRSGLIVLCLAPLVLHYRQDDESRNYLVDDYTHNMFASLKPNALVLSFQWDEWVSASYYYQLVKGERPDLVVIDKELLRRAWYLKELGVRFPWLISASRPEVEAFLREVDKFDHELPYNPAVIEARYTQMIASIIARSLPEHPVYVTGEVEPQYTRGYQRVPAGLAFRLFPDTLFHDEPVPQFRYRPFARRGRLEDLTRQLYAEALTAKGEYLYYRRGAVTEAKNAFLSAISFDPTALAPRRALARLGSPVP